MRLPVLTAGLALAASAAIAQSAAGPTPASRAPVDYAQDSAWLCRPGRADACSQARLDAVRVDGQGRRTPAPFRAATHPPIDCFYVYPTVSRDATDYSDLSPGPEEVATVQAQFARFGQVCRTFAPLYRQLTLSGLNRAMSSGTAGRVDLWLPAYEDVAAAWRSYLTRDNHGRGVVLIGHSQGTILLQRLLAEEIDGKPAQRLLVSAFLAGDPGLSVPAGREVGGTLKAIPVCRAAAQTGCVYPWGSYAEADAAGPRRFGRGEPGMRGACADAAAPGGGVGALTSYLHKPPGAPASDPPWVEAVGGFTAECRADAEGAVLRVSVTSAPYAELRRELLAEVQRTPGWGLHTLDVNLVQGNMLDDIAAETRSWIGAGR